MTDKLTGYPSIDKPWLKYYPKEALNEPLPEYTIYEAILKKNENRLDNIAIDYFGRKITYRQMFARIDEVAQAFSTMGVKKGDTVSLCTLTTPETVYSLYALNRLGAVANFIEPRTNPERIKNHTNNTKSKLLIVIDVFLGKINEVADGITADKIIVVPLSGSMPGLKKVAFQISRGRKLPPMPTNVRFMSWSRFIEAGKGHAVESAPYEKGRAAAIIYTGGTTGVPKGAVLSNETFTIMDRQSVYCNPRMYFQGNCFLDIMPPFIAYGLVFGLFIPFCTGFKNIIIPVFDPHKFTDLILKHKPNHVVGVPTFYESMSKREEAQNANLDFLMSAITGGDRLLPNTEKEINDFFKEHGCQYTVLKGYGMTEMGSAATFTATDECNVPGSVGVPCFTNVIMVIDHDTGKELSYYEHGEICITGPSMMLGYFDNDEETQKVFHRHDDGRIWIHTGDIGFMTEDGVLFIVDRMKRMIIRPDGHNVWPSQIEAVVVQHPAIAECAVVGMPNPENENGKIPTAFMVPKAEAAATDKLIDDVDCFCKERMPERDRAMAYRIIDEMPMTPVGKVDYRALEKMEN